MFCLILFCLVAVQFQQTSSQLHPAPTDLLVDATIAVVESCFVARAKSIHLPMMLHNKWSTFLDEFLTRLNYRVPVALVDPSVFSSTDNNGVYYSVVFIDSKDAYYDLCDVLLKKNFNVNSYFVIAFLEDDQPWMPTSLLHLTAELQMFNVATLFRMKNAVHFCNFVPFGTIDQTSPFIRSQYFDPTSYKTCNCSSYFNPKVTNFFAAPLQMATINMAPIMSPVYDKHQRVIDFVGIDGDLLKCLSQLLNFTIIPHISAAPVLWGVLSQNGTGTGAVGLVLNGTANFTLGFFALNLNKHTFFSYAYPYFQTSIIMVISPGLEYGPFERLLLPFQFSVWISFSAVFFVGIITIGVLKFFPKAVQGFVFGSLNQTPVVNFVKSTLGDSLELLPTRNFARFLLLLWISCCFVLRTVYQQIMFDHLSRLQNHSTAQNWDQFVAGGYRIFAMDRQQYFYENVPPNVEPRITTMTSQQYSSIYKGIRFGNIRGAASLYLESALYFNQKFFTRGSNAFYQIFPERLYSAPIAIFFPKNSPLVKVFDPKLRQLVAHGFVQHWRQKVFDRNLEVYQRSLQTQPQARPISLNALADVFGIYIVGMILATLVFCLEYVWWRMGIKREKLPGALRRRAADHRVEMSR
ncbi:glutamate receptor ionotropic, NMDA 3A-like [Uranotaenia lowii]|uniref:glutamate receptor ionotropic, NMDA 3A-like n=1 Tax=Uranotaenia lowii TaxID=190385 RepID=UPI0024785A47|nr:glutamate receptor ionotropic, NMDA 3A-like [Uranotaenia lowii]